MRTTLEIKEKQFKAAKLYAVEKKITLGQLVEKALDNYLPTDVKVSWIENPRVAV